MKGQHSVLGKCHKGHKLSLSALSDCWPANFAPCFFPLNIGSPSSGQANQNWLPSWDLWWGMSQVFVPQKRPTTTCEFLGFTNKSTQKLGFHEFKTPGDWEKPSVPNTSPASQKSKTWTSLDPHHQPATQAAARENSAAIHGTTIYKDFLHIS